MTKAILDLSASLRTQATPRSPSNTETPEPAPDPTESGFAKFLAQDKPESSTGPFRFVSGSKEHGIALSGFETLLVSSSQEHTIAFFEAPGANRLAWLMRVLPFIASYYPFLGYLITEVVERLMTGDTSTGVQHVPSSALTQAEHRYERFRNRLIAALLDEPIEDGVTHPAEHVIDEALRKNSSECRDWLSETMVEHYQTRPSIGASIVRCIGRLESDRVGNWGMHVADDALRHKDVEVREAAVRALEAWGGCEALSMLRSHRDSVAWLNEYVNQVIADLSRATS